ncbi:GPI11 [Candida metapsilosis]|uniref:Glycosylphosphatidylinositol anchor biosynthesis protein 11 n=1 Tax=Candida metapsilosis TaxID=273372 RepID=A0A8H7ZDT4_9ASCO|nr:GPI11 [Candida metapsilosis]
MKRSKHQPKLADDKPKPVKKSVSFMQDAPGEVSTGEDLKTSPKSASVVPQLKNNLLAIPIHNLLILWGLFHYRLTEDIESVMLKGFITSLPIQAGYNYLLAKNTTRKSKSTNIPLLVGSSILVSFLLAVPLFATLILLGAPVYKFSFKTLCLALHLSQLIFTPLLVLYELQFENFTLLFHQQRIYFTIFRHPVLSSVLLSLGCCWLGVIPIPLDWDRPWQQWPITLLVGGYAGGVVGSVLSLVVNIWHR